MKNEDIERILNYTTTMKSGTPYLEIVELIDEYKKQQKEIENLKISLQDTLSRQKNTLYFCIDDYVSKNKIKEKIKEYQEKAEDVKQKYKGVYAYKDDYLEALAKIEGYQELLKENTNE